MKRLIYALLSSSCAFAGEAVQAQAVAKAVLVEHFTNSYCSVCAGRNPGFYQNLAQFPQVLHVAYYPSAPYPACPINQYNRPEADARTNYYGVYGSTPRLVVQGLAISSNADYSSAAIFQSELGKTTSFDVSVQLTQLSATGGEARIVIRKADTSSLDSVSLYAAIVEDTLQFAAHNGEMVHYDVFCRSVWGTQPVRVKSPATVGDSIVMVQSFAIDAAWPLNRMKAIAIMQQANGALLQAARSGRIAALITTGVAGISGSSSPLTIFPNPATDIVYIGGLSVEDRIAMIYDLQGRNLSRESIGRNAQVSVRDLPIGQYILRVTTKGYDSRFLITRQ